MREKRGRGPRQRGKKMSVERWMGAIDGWRHNLPLRWHGLEPTRASPSGWAGFNGIQRSKNRKLFHFKIEQPLFEFLRAKDKEIIHNKM